MIMKLKDKLKLWFLMVFEIWLHLFNLLGVGINLHLVIGLLIKLDQH
jgi:hypothetical protein